MIKTTNPYTQQTLQEYTPHKKEEINQKILEADKAFDELKKLTFNEKKEALLVVAKQLNEKKQSLASLITHEMGKPIQESLAEVEKCKWVCEYYAEHAAEQLAPDTIQTDYNCTKIHYQPLGVILAVMPWNFPLWQVFRFAAPAFMAGNTMILKHASNVTGCAIAIEELFATIKHKDVFQTLVISASQVKSVIEHTAVKAVTLTGSEFAGGEVASTAAKVIKKAVLELGGSDPFIVCKDADVTQAVENAIKSRFLNTGQSCIAAKRFIIHTNVYEAFKSLLLKRVEQLQIGDPLLKETEIGPMAKNELAEELHELVLDAKQKGGTILIGGELNPQNKALYPPTIVENVNKDCKAYHEELFGPVAVLYEVQNDSEAIALANDTRFGLGASIWTQDKDKAQKMALEIECGNVHINSMVKSDPRIPFGGVKSSGYGRELASLGIKEFMNIKTICQ